MLRSKVSIKKRAFQASFYFFYMAWITYKIPKKLKFKIWGPLDLVEKSYGDHFFHFQQPLVASNDLRGLQALGISNL